LPDQYDRARWPQMRETFAKVFRSKSRDEWCKVFEGSDACFAPVLSWSEARGHPQSVSRKSYLSVGNVPQPAPAPRFSRTPGEVRREPPERGEGGLQALKDWGFGSKHIDGLKSQGLGTRE
jgi:alpha-methylacyl-CoA racemase